MVRYYEDVITMGVVCLICIQDGCILTSSNIIIFVDTFQGSWCQNQRNCRDLAKCIQDEINKVDASKDRPAFLTYLQGAPQLIKPEEGVDETNDPTRCSSLREYFSYDPDYADDTRICREVKELTVRAMSRVILLCIVQSQDAFNLTTILCLVLH